MGESIKRTNVSNNIMELVKQSSSAPYFSAFGAVFSRQSVEIRILACRVMSGKELWHFWSSVLMSHKHS